MCFFALDAEIKHTPGRSWLLPDTRARLALWPKTSVDEVEAPCIRFTTGHTCHTKWKH